MQNNGPKPIQFKKKHINCYLNIYKAPLILKTESSQCLIPIFLFIIRIYLLILTIHLILILHFKHFTIMPLAFQFASQCHTFSSITIVARSLRQNLSKHYKYHKIKMARLSPIYISLNKEKHSIKLITFL